MSIERMKTDAALRDSVSVQLLAAGVPCLGVEIFDCGSAVGAAIEVPAFVGGLSGLRGRHAFMTREVAAARAAMDIHGQFLEFVAQREAEPYPPVKIAC